MSEGVVSVHGSTSYVVLPGVHRDELLGQPQVPAAVATEDPAAWWRPAGVP